MEHEPFMAARQREDVRLVVAEVMDIADIKHVAPEQQGTIRVVGSLREQPEVAYDYMAPRLRELGYTALLQENFDQPEQFGPVSLLAIPGMLRESRSRLWLALLFFGLTVISTFLVGGLNSEARGTYVDWLGGWFSVGLGMAYSASLLSILLAHELGHFLAARRLGVAVSYPFFIPVPLPPLGTMGAFIRMQAPPPDRRSLLYIAVAGPLAGLVVAVPVLVLGLMLSEVQTGEAMAQDVRDAYATVGVEIPADEPIDGLLEGNSLLYAGTKIAVFGRFLPSGGEDVDLHPVAWAGWVGLLVTGLNLIPAGQLDGGHIFYALFGGRVARLMTWAMVGLLLVLALLGFWVGWFLWSFLIALLGQMRAPLLNELTPLEGRQRALALLGLLVFILVFTPAPITPLTIGG